MFFHARVTSRRPIAWAACSIPSSNASDLRLRSHETGSWDLGFGWWGKRVGTRMGNGISSYRDLRVWQLRCGPTTPIPTRHPPPATRHPPPATRQPPPATRHPPPATRHPPPATRHPPPAPSSQIPTPAISVPSWKTVATLRRVSERTWVAPQFPSPRRGAGPCATCASRPRPAWERVGVRGRLRGLGCVGLRGNERMRASLPKPSSALRAPSPRRGAGPARRLRLHALAPMGRGLG